MAVRDDFRVYPEEVAVSAPNRETLRFIRSTQCLYIAEVGIYKGHTSMELARFLGNRGELHLFDFEERTTEVVARLNESGFSNVKGFGSSSKLLDSYAWTLAVLYEQHCGPIYDYVFLDGAHTWAVDALATFIADRLLKVGGYLDLDDYEWTLSGSPSLNPNAFPLTARLYTEEQISAKQVRMIAELVIRRSGRYREVVPNKIFQKLQ